MTTMTEPQLVALDGEILGRMQTKLLSELAEQQEAAAEQDATATDLDGRGDAESIVVRDLIDAAAARVVTTIERIEAALVRIVGGTYGRCGACGRPIPIERLEAIPYAEVCVACLSSRPARRPFR